MARGLSFVTVHRQATVNTEDTRKIVLNVYSSDRCLSNSCTVAVPMHLNKHGGVF